MSTEGGPFSGHFYYCDKVITLLWTCLRVEMEFDTNLNLIDLVPAKNHPPYQVIKIIHEQFKDV